jgi:hypothetical protein
MPIPFNLTPDKTTPGPYYHTEFNSIVNALTATVAAYPMANIPTPASLGLFPNKAAGQKMTSAEYNNIVTILGGVTTAANGSTTTPTTPAAPTITGLDPTSAQAGATVIVTGTGFTGALNVLFAGTAVGSGKFQVLSDTQLTVIVPAVSAGSNPIQVVGQSGTSPARAFVVVAATTTTPTNPTTSQAPVILIGGQSNAWGKQVDGNRTGEAPLSQVAPSITREFQRVLIWTPGSGWQKLQAFANNRASSDNGPSFGAEIGLAQWFEATTTAGNLYLVKDAHDGQPISYFQKGAGSGQYANWRDNFVGPALANLNAAGLMPSIKGMYWSQGEADAGNGTYQSQLTTLFNSWLADGILPGTAIQLISECKTSSTVAAAQQAYVTATSQARLIPTANYATGPDGLHYNEITQYLCGYVDIPNAIYGQSRAYPFSFAGGVSLPKLAAPTNFRVTGVTDTSISYAWDGASNASGYAVQFAADAGMSQAVTTTAAQASTTVTFKHDNLPSGTKEYARVRTLGDGSTSANSDYSGVISGTTTTPAVVDHTIEDSDSLMHYVGNWGTYAFGNRASGLGNNVMASNDPNAYLVTGFNGPSMYMNWPIYNGGCTAIEVVVNDVVVTTYNGQGADGTFFTFTTPAVAAGNNVFKVRPAPGASGYLVADALTAKNGIFYYV